MRWGLEGPDDHLTPPRFPSLFFLTFFWSKIMEEPYSGEPWWGIYGNVTEFADFLVEICEISTMAQLSRYFHKPWNWNEEHAKYVAASRLWDQVDEFVDFYLDWVETQDEIEIRQQIDRNPA